MKLPDVENAVFRGWWLICHPAGVSSQLLLLEAKTCQITLTLGTLPACLFLFCFHNIAGLSDQFDQDEGSLQNIIFQANG